MCLFLLYSPHSVIDGGALEVQMNLQSIFSNTADTDFLTVEKHFREVQYVLHDIRYKWEAIGIALGLSRADVNNLKGDDEKNLGDVIEMWLKRRHLKPTWTTLAAALQQKTVDAGNVADEIEEKYLGEFIGKLDIILLFISLVKN